MVLIEEVMDTSPAPEVSAGIEKLRGRENYAVWKFQMKNMLIHEDLWFPIAGYPEGDTTEEATKVRNDQKALSKINLMLGISCIYHTMRAQTALEAWHALENVYEDKGRVHLLQKLLSMQKEDHVSVEDYINEVTKVSEQIAQTGNPVDEEILGVVLLRGFPNSDTLKGLIMSLEDSGATLTSDIVKRWLMLSCMSESGQSGEIEEFEETDYVEEKRTFFRWFQKTSTLVENTFDDKLLQPKSIKNSPHEKGKGKQVVCFKCNQPGHKRNQCTNATTEGGSAGPSNNSSETTFRPKNVGKAITESAAETIAVKAFVAIAGAVGGTVATVASVGVKAFKKK